MQIKKPVFKISFEFCKRKLLIQEFNFDNY